MGSCNVLWAPSIISKSIISFHRYVSCAPRLQNRDPNEKLSLRAYENCHLFENLQSGIGLWAVAMFYGHLLLLANPSCISTVMSHVLPVDKIVIPMKN